MRTPAESTKASYASSAASDAVSGAAETVSERLDEGMAGARDLFDRLGRALPGKETLGRRSLRFPIFWKGNRWSLARLVL